MVFLLYSNFASDVLEYFAIHSIILHPEELIPDLYT
jgi:hypothetical protein